MIPLLLSLTQISQLLRNLEVLGDQSLQMRSVILFEKRFPAKQFQVFVDVWPEFTAILIKQKLSDILNVNYYLFASVKENLKKMLLNTDIMELDKAIFRFCTLDVHHIIEAIANERGFRVNYSSDVISLYKSNRSKLKQTPVPEDVTVGLLTSDMVDLVTKNCGSYVPYDNIEPHIRYLITNHPTVSVCDSNGKLIAYELSQEYGGLGMLFVEPGHRRRGLGKMVTNLLLRKDIDLGLLPIVYIIPDNEVSIKLHIDLGFEKTDVLCKWAKLVPK